MRKLKLVVDDNFLDAFAVFLAENTAALGLESQLIKISELLGMHGVEYDSNGMRFFRHSTGNNPQFSSPVLARIFEVSKGTFEQIAPGDESFYIGQVTDAIAQCLGHHSTYVPCVGLYALGGSALPLPSLWYLAKLLFGLNHPNFCFEYGPCACNASDFARPLRKSPFDYYQWALEHSGMIPKESYLDDFVVDVPVGNAVVSYLVGDTWWCEAPVVHSVPHLSQLQDQLEWSTRSLRRLLGGFALEVLWIIGPDASNPSVTLLAASPLMKSLSRSREAIDRVKVAFESPGVFELDYGAGLLNSSFSPGWCSVGLERDLIGEKG